MNFYISYVMYDKNICFLTINITFFNSLFYFQIKLSSCLKEDELAIPFSPPRRLSRSSIDLRDLDQQHDIEKVTHTESAPTIGYYFEKYLKPSDYDVMPKKHGNFFPSFLDKTNMIKSPFEYLTTSLNGVKKEFNIIKKESPEDKAKKGDVSRRDMIKGWKANSVDDSYSYLKLPLGALSESDFFSIKNSIESNGNFKIKKNVLNNAFSDSGVIVCKNKSNKLEKKRKFFSRHGKNKEYMSLEREIDDLDEKSKNKEINPSDNLLIHDTPDILLDVVNMDSVWIQSKTSMENIKYNNRILSEELINLNITDSGLNKINTLKAQSLDSNKLDNNSKCFTSHSDYSTEINDETCSHKVLSKSSDAVLESKSKPTFILNENIYSNIIIDSCSDKLDSDIEVNIDNEQSKHQITPATQYLLSPPYTPCVNYNIKRFQQKELNSLASTNNTHMFSDASTISLDIITSPRISAKPPQILSDTDDQCTDTNTILATNNEDNNSMLIDEKLVPSNNIETRGKCEASDNYRENTLNVSNSENNENVTKRVRHPSSVTYDINVINFSQDSGTGNYGAIAGRGRPSTSSGSKSL